MFPYFNLNIQMLAAHQQALAAAQLSPNRFNNHHIPDDIEDDDEDMTVLPSANDRRLLDLTNPESPSSSVPNTSLNRTIDENMAMDEPIAQQPAPKHTSTPKQTEIIDKHVPVDVCNGTTRPESSSTPAPIKMYDCKFCGISFQDAVLHTIHMGYHGYNDVFTCNMCGEKCSDRISFFLHIAKNQHS